MIQQPGEQLYRQHVSTIAALAELNLSEQRVEELAHVVREYFQSARLLNDLPYTWGTEPAVVFQLPVPRGG